MMNNKGFTLIEILAVVTIMGILMGIAITGYSRYISLSRKKAYDILAKSAEEAMEDYTMDYPMEDGTITFKKLVDLEYLERPTDPKSKESVCTGSVKVTSVSNYAENSLDTKEYEVILCCIGYKKKYTFPGKDIEDYDGAC